MKNLKYIVCFIILAFSITISNIPLAVHSRSDDTITIYHTNDMHGKVNSIYNENELTQIGLDIVKSEKDNTKNSILIDAGDGTQGTPMGKYSKGIDIVEMMNATGYDGMVLGNHEFDYGRDSVMQIAKAAKFPVISANTLYNGEIFLRGVNGNNGCNFIKEINGKKLGFFGITTEETIRTTIPTNLEGITFKDEMQTVKEQINELRKQGVDAVIGVMHIGIDSSSKITSREIAEGAPGIDVIIDGHSHSQTTERVGKTLIQQTGTGSNNLGKIEVSFTSSGPQIKAELIKAQQAGEQCKADEGITKIYDSFASKIAPVLEKVIGKTENTLYGGNYGGKNISRMVETNLGSLIGDAMICESKELLKGTKYKAMPIVAMENGGAVRSKIPRGFITMEDVLEVLPLDNKLSLQIINPNILYQVMERGVSKQKLPGSVGEPIDGFFGGYPQISGMRIEYDITKPAYDDSSPHKSQGQRVTKIVILNENNTDANILDRNDTETKIMFACNDYTITEYPTIKNIDLVIKGGYLSDILANHINMLTMRNEEVFRYPLTYQRSILSKPSELFGIYNAKVLIKEKSNVLISKDIEVKIDNKEYIKMTTNTDGEITLNDLQSGGHSIVIKNGLNYADVYVDETIGIKIAEIDIALDTEKNIKSVINLINQIPEDPIKTDQKIIGFARTSYDLLPNIEKMQITNSNILFDSENSLKDNIFSKYIIVSLICIAAIVAGVIIVRARKKVKK